MQFKSIEDLVERTEINAKAAECLGLAGALSTLEDDLNELESAEYTKEMVSHIRKVKLWKMREEKYEENLRTKEERFRREVEERQEKMEKKVDKYQERVRIHNQRLLEVKEKNQIKEEKGQKLIKIPEPPSPPKPLKEIVYPTTSEKPEEPQPLGKPRITLSLRERIRLQRDMLKIYISGHPLDEVQEEEGVTKIQDLPLLPKGSTSRIQGVLQSLRVTTTRTGTLMARLRIEDKTGTTEVVAFSRVYEGLKGTLEEGNLYKVIGKVDTLKIYDPESGEERTHIQLKGLKIQPLKISADKEWDINYPLLKGSLRILPGLRQKAKGLALKVLSPHYER